MLTPDQVLPFLRHDDEMIRGHAVRYFAQAHDVGPLTVDEIWMAAEHLGLDERGIAVLGLIEHVPQNDASTDRLLAAIERMAAVDDPILEELLFVVDLIDLDQLRRQHARIRATPGIDDEQRAELSERLELANLPHDQLWERLVRETEAIRAAADGGVHWLNADRIVQALAQHGSAAAERATAVLSEPPDPESSLPLFAIDLLGILRHRPALGRLLELFAATDEEDDAQHEALMHAIPSVGGTDALPAIETSWGAHGSTYQLFAAGVLGRIKHPQSEETLLRLIDGGIEDYVRDRVASALTALCTTAGLPRLREMVLREEYDPTMIDLKEDLVVCALMAGYDFTELSTLREEVIAKEVDRERRLERLMADPDFLKTAEGAADLDDLLYGEDYDDEYDDDYDELPPQLDDRAPRVVAPIHNPAPKIGRNDPCPCGSGKKYKKCCLDKTA